MRHLGPTVLRNTIGFLRGYTGHEMLPEFNLINMNGRVYDPVLGRFLSPDNYVQMPDNTQSFNRYSYCINNPLKYTDPSGEFWNLIFGAAFGGIFNWMTHGFLFNAKGLGYFATGALAGATGAGIAGGMNVSMAGGGFWAGAAGLANGVSSTGFIAGAATGASAGFSAGIISGAGNSWVDGHSFGTGLLAGLSSGFGGALSGGISGGLSGGFDALDKGTNFWTGKANISTAGAYSVCGDIPSDIEIGKITITGKYVGTYQNVNVYESKRLGSIENTFSAVTVPERGIIAAEGVFTSVAEAGRAMMQHEFGHILQYRKIGAAAYWHVIAPESFASITLYPSGHDNFWTETWANYLSKGYFGKEWIGKGPGFYYPVKNISNFNLFRINSAILLGKMTFRPRGIL
ncbi:RHS repeat-associated core domain-containing protein [Palleniella muris]|nr:RHS repeat-associated core domain-containing protein [Palleniella muris]